MRVVDEQARAACRGNGGFECGNGQSGAALAVALILLVILTLIAVSGMSLATAELAMAGNEQLRRRAADAADER